MEEESTHVLPEDMVNEELETLVMASIQTLKRSNKKCGKDKVFELVNNSLEKQISSTGIFLSLPKKSQLNKQGNEIVGTGSNEDKEYQRNIINEN